MNGYKPMDEIWLEELREALADPALEAFDRAEPCGEEARRAAYNLAAALGRCRVFGVVIPPEMEGTLPLPMATVAAEEAATVVTEWAEEAQALPTKWDSASPEEADAMVAEVVESLMDSYFVMEVIWECYERALQENDPQMPQLEQALDKFGGAVETFDKILQQPEQLAILATVCSLPLLENFRKCLADEYRAILPWWLDGTLEAAAEQVARVVEATLPSAETWRRVREWVRREPRELATPRRHRAAAVLSVPWAYPVAAEATSVTPPIREFLEWMSPDGRWRARLSIPSMAKEETPLPVEFLAGEQPAVELQGTRVRLAGVEAQIDAEGVARFVWSAIRQAFSDPDAELILEVGEEPIEWVALGPDVPEQHPNEGK